MNETGSNGRYLMGKSPDDQAQYLSHLPPHMLENMFLRIDRIRSYLAEPTRGKAEAFAHELKMGVGHFKMLAHAFSIHQRADKLPGAHWPKTRRTNTREEQLALIQSANNKLPGSPIEDVVRLAKAMAKEQNLALPSPTTLRARVHELRSGQSAETLFGHDCHIVVAHAALNIPVDIDGIATMPVAAIAIAPVLKKVIGIDLSIDGPDASATAEALRQALTRLPLPAADKAKSGPIRIALDFPNNEAWIKLRAALLAGGAECTSKDDSAFQHNLATAYLGRRHNHIEIKPRKLLKPFTARKPQIIRNQHPMPLQEARDFAVRTLIGDIKPAAIGPAIDRLQSELAKFLHSN